MYELTPRLERQQIGHSSYAAYDDDYEEYLLWHSTTPYVMLRVEVVDPYEVPLIPHGYLEQQRLMTRGPEASPLSVSYSATPNFKFPDNHDQGVQAAPVVSRTNVATVRGGMSNAVKTVRRGLRRTRRRLSCMF